MLIQVSQGAFRALAAARIGLGIAICLNALENSAILMRVADGRITMPVTDHMPAPTATLALTYLTATLVAGVTVTLGLFTRFFAAIAAVLQMFALLWDQQVYTHHAWLITLLTLLLVLSTCDRAWAVGASSRQRTAGTPWAPLLIMSLLSICYLFAGLSKINGEFLSGEHFQQWLRWPLSDSLNLTIAILTVPTECFLAVGLWFTRTRVLTAVTGFALHLSIVVLMNEATYHLVTFAIAALCLYPLFFTITLQGARINSQIARRTVIWDSGCSFCRRWIALFRFLDWFRLHRFVGSSEPGAFDDARVTPAMADEAIQLLTPTTHAQGFDAVRRVLATSPLTFWTAPILWLPPVNRLGDRLYKRVAARRTCQFPPSKASERASR